MESRRVDHNSPVSPQHMEEKLWVRKVREEGDKAAFEKLFRAYYKRLHGFAYSYVNQRETAEDVVQSVFLKIWDQRENWNPPGTVKQYLFVAVRNEVLNKIRHQQVVSDARDEIARVFKKSGSQTLPGEDPDAEELRRKIQDGIDNLPARCRQIFLLNRRGGLTYAEIAEYLDLSINTVTTQMGRALQSLRNHLSDYLSFFVAAEISKWLL